MAGIRTLLHQFLADHRGAVTIDWVALSAGVLLLGVTTVYGVFGAGLSGAIADTNGTLIAASSFDFGPRPTINFNN